MVTRLNAIMHYKVLGTVTVHGGTSNIVLSMAVRICAQARVRTYTYMCRCTCTYACPPCIQLKALMVGIEGGKLMFMSGDLTSLCREGSETSAERWDRNVAH